MESDQLKLWTADGLIQTYGQGNFFSFEHTVDRALQITRIRNRGSGQQNSVTCVSGAK